MKKRMFITTIVMMLVLAVALTTSSLAWFTSANTSVTAQSANFTATSSGSSTVNLKISDTTGSWGNTIKLTSAEGRSMVGMIPQTALIADIYEGESEYEAPTFTGVDINGGHVDVVHGDYYWPARIAFNSATIDDESFFIIDKDASGNGVDGNPVTGTDKNGVVNYGGNAVNNSTGYYYDEFYIHNADTQSVINKLTFKVTGGLTVDSSLAETSDYTCNGYAAFILFDEVAVAVGDTVPSNALHNPGATVIANGGTPSGNQVAAGTHNYFIAWVPFAAFTIAMDKDNDGLNDNDDVVAEANWQFADLDAFDDPDSPTVFKYNRNVNGDGTYSSANIGIANLPTQQYDALSGNANEDGFVLNSDSLKMLNNKVINATTGNVTNTGNPSRDTSSEFVMPAGETFKVAFYFWLDGYTMTSFTDTTKATVGIKIEADQVSGN